MRTIRLSAPLDNQNPSEFSWWQKDLRNECAVSITPPLTGKKSADIAIIGGGFTVMWAALAIKRRDDFWAPVLVELRERLRHIDFFGHSQSLQSIEIAFRWLRRSG